MPLEKCEICKKYNFLSKKCTLCEFEYDEDYSWTSEEWDILNIDEEEEWAHLQLVYRLYSKGIECLRADIWWDNNIAYIFAPKASLDKIARALGVHKEVLYFDHLNDFVIINLFQEKYLRGLLDKEN